MGLRKRFEGKTDTKYLVLDKVEIDSRLIDGIECWKPLQTTREVLPFVIFARIPGVEEIGRNFSSVGEAVDFARDAGRAMHGAKAFLTEFHELLKKHSLIIEVEEACDESGALYGTSLRLVTKAEALARGEPNVVLGANDLALHCNNGRG